MRTDIRPNVMLITLDECKASALGCYGNPACETPHIDALAAQGIRFTQAFATSPKCVPSRCSMLTGRYPHAEGHRTLPGFTVRAGEANMLLDFKSRGYETALFGDGSHWVDPDIHEYTFDVTGRVDDSYRVRQLPDERDEPAMFRAMYRPEDCPGETTADARQAALAARYIASRAADAPPFFMILDLQMPHPPYLNVLPYVNRLSDKEIRVPEIEPLAEAPEVLRRYRSVYGLEQLQENDWQRILRAYYSMTALADDCVGQVLAALDKAGLADNTIVVLTSDHGDFAGEHGAVEKWDTMFYDCLMHVPLIVRDPRQEQGRGRQGGSTSSALTDHTDLAPTLLELCGLPASPMCHGRSLVPVLTGQTNEHKRYVFGTGGVEAYAVGTAVNGEDAFYRQYPTYLPKQEVMLRFPETIHRARMIRSGKWKLVFRLSGGHELYDLENDPGELRNVRHLAENREIVAELTEELLRFSLATETDYPPIGAMMA